MLHNLEDTPFEYTVSDYQYGFSQPHPAYGLKDAKGWKTVHQPLSQAVITQHLMKSISIGTYGRWYPRFGIIDLDDVEIGLLYDIRSRLGMDDSNSIIFTSESPNSYHIYFKPTRKGKMLNLNLYLKCMAVARDVMNIEIYPQATRFIRLPFGKGQHWLNEKVIMPINYKEGMELLSGIHEYDIDRLPYLPSLADELYPSFEQPLFHDFGLKKGWKQEGLSLINSGLEQSGTRLDSLKKVIYFYWSQNLPLESTITMAQAWIKEKNNGLSKDYQSNPQAVLKQIAELTNWIYTHFDRSYTLPDSAHIVDKGYLTAELTKKIVVASSGRLPILKFGLQLFAYLAPRNNQANKIAVHSDRLIEWSSRDNYLAYIDHFKQAGLLKRDARYKVGHYAKGISLLTGQTRHADALKWEEDRPSSGLHEIIPQVYTPQDYANQLKAMNVERSQIRKHINEIYGETKPTEVRTKKANTQERIKKYLKEHPNATQQEIAKALNINQSTISRNMKN